MPPLRKKQRYSLSSTDRHCDGSDYAVVDDVDCDSESEEVVCQGVSTASGSEPGGSVPLVVGGVFMVGAQPPTSYELDLRYEYARQHVYLLRNVRVGDLQVPTHCKAEPRVARQTGISSVDSLSSFLRMQRSDGPKKTRHLRLLLTPVPPRTPNGSRLGHGISVTWPAWSTTRWPIRGSPGLWLAFLGRGVKSYSSLRAHCH